MGNCLRHESPMHWADDDWDTFLEDGFLEEEVSRKTKHGKSGVGRDLVYKETRDRFEISSSSSSRVTNLSEVKIKITKKQLEELLGKVNVKELSVPQVLAYWIDHGNEGYEANQRSWRPVLQSIPEIN